ncbi:AbrB/MazE/SpoVT family DNA-binding domain-containing protein [Asticcacaulis sp. EMRT-3]|uniref:AbrB/MazE/SpoVT family DNA-binding domain-containing protein n=1 Tax=Asticcacaulis sp. EMRT-3 TaxID=3040349 RepID=UPI0024AE9CF4|nr:AbrB/MazE/SpoVT family DNA-binding domain-containing protein [Asticcacaulis sp. EMRT-3]MDI7775482.1 AbrB/MazE/SpoVT family DNA-binding domain-containing protein [Asticcacaulis sp. EMRT-3]
MLTTLKKWGNSPSVRIPADIMRRANLHIDQKVEVELVDGVIHIRSAEMEDEADLDAMIALLTPDNLHGFVGTGPALGQEGGE